MTTHGHRAHQGRPQDRIQEHLRVLYGSSEAPAIWSQLQELAEHFLRQRGSQEDSAARRLDHRDAVLITYGDQFQEAGKPPLRTLRSVLAESLQGIVSTVHILPFFPFSSDDGFSVIDFEAVNPALGDWPDVEDLKQDRRLMFDLVINHISRHHRWFQRFLAGDPDYADWFISFAPDAVPTELNKVFRPRALPLLTRFDTQAGERMVWTTFSDDQVDLNYAHPPVLLAMIDVLLFYVLKGASLIRLDAVAYLWKEVGTSSIHLPETHRVIKLMRAVLDWVAPETILITETNVPHEENISYFGLPIAGSSRTDEAQMVYQFPLAPLLVHTLLTGQATKLSRWASNLETPAPDATFFNFTASHDGIGLMPTRGLLSEGETQALINAALAHGGQVSYKTNQDGSRTVYELNISYFDALSDPHADEPLATQVARFAVSQAIMLALAGVPGIYVHSLVGSRSWTEGVQQTGHNRSINREKISRQKLDQQLADPSSLRHQVFQAYAQLLRARASDPAFHPQGGQRVLDLGPGLFSLLRSSPDGASQVLCLHNVSSREQMAQIKPTELGLPAGVWRDLVAGQEHKANIQSGLQLALAPYQVSWLRI